MRFCEVRLFPTAPISAGGKHGSATVCFCEVRLFPTKSMVLPVDVWMTW